jgi:glutamate racemase
MEDVPLVSAQFCFPTEAVIIYWRTIFVMDNRPIGIFDSGLGGLTAVSALRQLLPEENIVYFADSARVPYGEKSREQLLIMAQQDLDFVASHSAKAIIAACGTVSSNAAHILESYSVPTTDVLKPAIEVMSHIPGHGALGIIATEASIRAGAFRKALELKAPGREIIDLPCPEFVPLIESGHISPDDPLLQRAVESALAPAKALGISALLLGCTHYGIIQTALTAYLGDSVEIVSASACAAQLLCNRLRAEDKLGGSGQLTCYTSGSAEEFSRAASALLGCPIQARHVEPMII